MSDATMGLTDLLEAERRYILDGDLDRLGRIADRKSRLMARLPDAKATLSDLQTVQALASRNAQLLEAALRGLKGARLRLQGPMRQPATRTYALDGSTRPLGAPERTVERRA